MFLAGVCVAVALLHGPAVSADSIFFVEGLAVDTLESAEEMGGAENFFEAELKRKPLVTPKPSRLLSLMPRQAPDAMRSDGVFRKTRPAYVQIRQAERYIDSGKWEHARLAMEKALELEPGNPFLIQRAAALSAIAGKYGVADSYFRQSLQLDPDNVPFLAGWAGVLIRLQRFEEAQEKVDRALELQPGYLAATFNDVLLAVVRRELDDIDGEWGSLRFTEIDQVAGWLKADRDQLLELLTPEGFRIACDIMIGLGTADRLEDISERIRACSVAMSESRYEDVLTETGVLHSMGLRSYWVKMRMAQALYYIEEFERSLELLRQLTQEHNDEVPVWFNTGYVLVRLNKYDEAADAFARTLELDPQYMQGRFALACAYAGQDKVDKAWPILEDLAKADLQRLHVWMEGDEPYLNAIRKDPRYTNLMRPLR